MTSPGPAATTPATGIGNGLPEPRLLTIAERGTTSIWDFAPTRSRNEPSAKPDVPVLLLHGWNVDGRLNFESALPSLTARHRVVLFDQHGHGAGVRTDSPFDLDACADDAIAVLDELHITQAIIVGYSLGGAVAQLIARRHEDRCHGLVLAATADRFSETARERTQFAALATGARAMRHLPPKPTQALFQQISAIACRRYPPWVLDTVRQADPVTLLEAGAALGRFDSTTWTDTGGVPTSVVITASDTVVDPRRQRRLATQLAARMIVEVDADHDLPIRNDPRFADALVSAIHAVSGLSDRSSLG